MIFSPTEVDGAYVVEIEPQRDVRGFFARTWCRREFEEHGLKGELAQCSMSYNARRGTLRGMHWQAAPSEEAKLVRCTSGAVHDVIIDLRPDSPSFLKHAAVVLTQGDRRALYVPPGVAHGFQTLADDSELLYQMSDFFSPEHVRGVRWNDPAFGLEWPIPDPIILDRDNSYADYLIPANVIAG
ncbi:MAG TPA: dTDP-4-dehydrorhamnose 3,5-epimerase family protein [Gemmatimonadaceae bacterium]